MTTRHGALASPAGSPYEIASAVGPTKYLAMDSTSEPSAALRRSVFLLTRYS